ncbi:MAG: ABC transporter substrate-binding protein [Desulfomonilaceae bacterium]|nr:ABC transporter substrate-binding protein [Desulfomonilaceae bacterium]
MLNRLWTIIVILFALIAHGTESCGQYRVGLALPSSEDKSGTRFAEEVQRALTLFKEQLDGTLGEELKREFGVAPPNLIFQTKECPPKNVECAVENAKEFVESDCVAVIGHTYSAPALAAGKIYDRHKVVMITPTATQRDIATVSNRVFRLTFDDRWQGSVIAAYVYKILERTKVVIAYERTVYGLGLLNSFKEQSASMGVQPMAEIEVQGESPDDEIKAAGGLISQLDSADAVVLFTAKDTALNLFRAIRSRNTEIPIIGADNLLWSDFARAVDKEVGRLKLSEPRLMAASPFFYELAPLRAFEFKRDYEKRFSGEDAPVIPPGEPHYASSMEIAPFQALFVDAALLVTRGIMAGLAKEKQSVSELREEIFTYLSTLNNPSDAVEGITGKLYFDKDGNIPRPVLFGWLKGTKFQPAYLQLVRDRPPGVEGCPDTEDERARDSFGTRTIPVEGELLRPRYVVYTGINLYRIDNVDLLRQTFDAEFFLWFKWMKPDELVLDANTIFFWNALHTADDQLVPLAQRSCDDVKYQGFRIKGTFLDLYDLRNYPFDSQWLNLTLSLSPHGASRILLAVDDDVHFAADRFKIFPGEYHHVGRPEHASGTLPLNASFGDPNRKTVGGRDYEYSVYQVTFGVARNPFPYLLKMFLPLFVLIGICLAVFWVPMEHFGVRITLVMTSLLSTIVFHMSRAGALPNVGYLTLADRFFVCAYVVMSLSIASNLWVEWLVKKEFKAKAETLNSGARYVLVSASVIVFLTLSLPATETWYYRALVGAGLLFSLWLVYEFLRHNEPVRARIKAFLLLRTRRDT